MLYKVGMSVASAHVIYVKLFAMLRFTTTVSNTIQINLDSSSEDYRFTSEYIITNSADCM